MNVFTFVLEIRNVRKIAKALGTRMKNKAEKITCERNLRKAVMQILNLQLLMSLRIHYIDYSIVLFDGKKRYFGNLLKEYGHA